MTRWKFDTSPKDPLVALRIPVTSKWPVFPYLVAFHKGSPHRPTAQEALMLSSFAEMRKTYGFGTADQNAMDDEPFDYHKSVPTVIFHKYRHNDWGYRLSTWTTGSAFAPPSPKVATRTIGPMSLLQVMDMILMDQFAGIAGAWTAWKERHPEVFG